MNGLLLVDKPGGCTSHDVVNRMRRATGEQSIGHLGTLDPMATGLLPLLLGKWTRLAKFYGSLAKTYSGVIRFGFATETFDAEGKPMGSLRRPSMRVDDVRRLADGFLGESMQMPPAYSAKKINGKPAYEYARAGEQPELHPVPITVSLFEIESLKQNADGTADAAFRMKISSGGYVRSVAHEMGRKAFCGAHLLALRRVAVGAFTVESALTLDEADNRGRAGTLAAVLPHPRMVLPELPAVTADAPMLERLRHGNQLALPEFSSAPSVRVFAGQRELAAIADRLAGTLFQPRVVLL